MATRHYQGWASLAYVAIVVALTTSATAASPKSEFDNCVRKLCTSTSQGDCWVKAGAAMCDRDQVQCRDLPDNAPAKILSRSGERWQVQTGYGKGYVSGRMMMADGSKCSMR